MRQRILCLPIINLQNIHTQIRIRHRLIALLGRLAAGDELLPMVVVEGLRADGDLCSVAGAFVGKGIVSEVS